MTNQVGARYVDRETNTSVIEIRPPREEAGADIIHAHSQGIQVPSSSSIFSSSDWNLDESMARPHISTVMPQLEGPISACIIRKQPVLVVRRTALPREGYPNESDSNSQDNRFCEDRRYPGQRRYYQERGGRPLNRENNQG